MSKRKSPARAAAVPDVPPVAENFPLRLEWRTPAELADNPANWRQHPESQTAPLAQTIRQVGWAGASLYNEATGRLIDGHARKKLPADTLVNGKLPVLVGRWSEEQERLILATLDPIAGLAEANQEALGELLMKAQGDFPAFKDFTEQVAAQYDLDLYASGAEDGNSTAKTDEQSDDKPDRWGVYAECKNEEQQAELLKRMGDEGFDCFTRDSQLAKLSFSRAKKGT